MNKLKTVQNNINTITFEGLDPSKIPMFSIFRPSESKLQTRTPKNTSKTTTLITKSVLRNAQDPIFGSNLKGHGGVQRIMFSQLFGMLEARWAPNPPRDRLWRPQDLPAHDFK